MSKHGIRLTNAIITDGIIILLGMTVLTQFYDLLMRGIFTPTGFSAQILHIAQYIPASGWEKNFIAIFLSLKILAPFLGVIMLLSAVGLILLIARGPLTIVVSIGYLITWVLLWHFPSVWTFEFLFPALFGLCAGISKLRQPVLTTSIYQKLSLSKTIHIAVIVLLSCLLWYVTFIAYTDKILATTIAGSTGCTFLILSLIQFGMDKIIINKDHARENNAPWMDIIIITIGAMMIMQVYANYFSGLFAIKDYTSLIQFYSTVSDSQWLRPFLAWSAIHSHALLPLQIIFESALAIFLPLLILRGPTLIAASILFGILAFAELGVSASWPPDPTNLNWEWELLLVTAVALLLGIGKTQEMLHAASLQEKIMGKKLFPRISIIGWIIIAAVGGICLFGAGMLTHIFGDQYKIISIFSGITFFILLLISILINKYRS